MRVIGITGGVGAGKSAILDYVETNFRAGVLKADEIAHGLMQPGTRCYVELRRLLPENVFLEDGQLDRPALSKLLFERDDLRAEVNAIVHPAVKVQIIDKIAKEREIGALDYMMVEAALLIEDHYDEVCDELWYVYASEDTRRRRLMESRGYSEEKVAQIFASQLTEGQYRKHCQVVIDNNREKEYAFLQVMQELNEKGEVGMDYQELEEKLVFGLDIGTRNVVGTVGYKEGNEFFVVAQQMKEHETRSMLDGQIHDIGRVGRTIDEVKKKLEEQLGIKLHDVCIAAAGRVLKTVSATVEHEFPEETVVEGEHVHTLDLMGVEKAQQILNENNDTHFKFYCVGYSVIRYYLNDDLFSSLEGHKATKIGEDIIVTFLPEDVVDGLYSAVALAGLRVANLTLEPIAAINVAIPESFRMLNLALVDVGAGTSDICVTKDGSIIAYGMIPCAGDEITELIVQNYLVDFKMAEHIKLASGSGDEIEFTDIMSLSHTIPAEEVWELVEPLVTKLAKDVADKIKELNGDKSVSATFVVGGGGKIHGFVQCLAKELGLPQERVALRGEEVLRDVHFEQQEIKKDPLLVTPIGICLNYYEQRNNFIFVRFNGERIKLYDNGHLTVVDAAIEAGFPNEQLFPRRGKEINFTLDGRKRIARGEAGESAVVKVNGSIVNINTPLEPNADITIEPSTVGEKAVLRLEQLEEHSNATISFEVNGRMVTCPRFFEVNGVLEPPSYLIQEGDSVEIRSYYTVSQLKEFMDVEIDMDREILVNNRPADLDTLVYENFSIDWTVEAFLTAESDVPSRPQIPPLLEKAGISNMPQIIEPEPEESAEPEESTEAAESELEPELEESAESAAVEPKPEESAEAVPQIEESVESAESAVAGPKPVESVADADGLKPADGVTDTGVSKPMSEVTGAVEPRQTEHGALSTSAPKPLEEVASAGAPAGESKQTEAVALDTGETTSASESAEATAESGALEAVSPAPTSKPQRTLRRSFREEYERAKAQNPKPVASPSEDTAQTVADEQPSASTSAEVAVSTSAATPTGAVALPSAATPAEAAAAPAEVAATSAGAGASVADSQSAQAATQAEPKNPITVKVNQDDITLSGKDFYILVDIFDYVPFDLNAGGGKEIVLKLNGGRCPYMQEIKNGDVIELYWQE